MKSFTLSTSAITSLVLSASLASGQNAPPPPAANLKTLIYKGCYSSSGSMKDNGAYLFQTSGYCQGNVCVPKNQAVMALSDGSHCWCGDTLPPDSAKVDNDQCRTPCKGSDNLSCGGNGKYMVYLTGTEDNVETDDSDSDSDAAATSSHALSHITSTPAPTHIVTQKPSVITVGGQTSTVYAPDQQQTAPAATTIAAKSSGPGKAAIAAAVVVGVVAVAAIVGGFFLFFRMKKRRAVEEEYRRNAAIENSLTKDSASSVSDSRLEPSVMMQRRQSDGSIMDNQDYSRRILKVTNPDGH